MTNKLNKTKNKTHKVAMKYFFNTIKVIDIYEEGKKKNMSQKNNKLESGR